MKSCSLKAIIALMLFSFVFISCSEDSDAPLPRQETEPVEVKIEHPKYDTPEKSNAEFTYFSFKKGQLKINNEEAKKSLDWDIAFLSTAGRTNGGTSGTGQAQVFMTETEDFDGIKSAMEFVEQENMWKVDEEVEEVSLFKMPPTKVTDNFNPYLIHWYSISFESMPPKTTTDKRVFIIRTANGDKYVKLQFISPYGVIKANSNAEAGNVRFRYQYIPLEGETNTAKRMGEFTLSGEKPLSEVIPKGDAAKIKYLIVKNEINQKDFDFMKESMPNLTELDLTNATLSVDFYEYLLKDNKSIKKVIMPKTIEAVGLGWLGYTALEEVVFQPNSIKRIGKGAFAFSHKLKKVVLPESLETIEPEAFYACMSLERITIPEKVILISPSCFYYCKKLNFVEFKGNVKTLGDDLFGYCENIGEIKFHSSEPPTYEHYPFSDIKNEKFFISVPKGSVDAYISAWPEFTDEYKYLFHEFEE